jgi:K+-transporting ATPase KdpF subunit
MAQSRPISKLNFFTTPRGNTDGYRLFVIDRNVLCGDRAVDQRVRIIAGAIMSWIYLLSSGLSLAVFVYLLVALFYPEKF